MASLTGGIYDHSIENLVYGSSLQILWKVLLWVALFLWQRSGKQWFTSPNSESWAGQKCHIERKISFNWVWPVSNKRKDWSLHMEQGLQNPLSTSVPSLLSPCLTGEKDVLYFCLFKCLFPYLTAPGLSCGIGDLVPWTGVEPRTPALGAWSLSHWTTRGVPRRIFKSTPYCFGCFK